MNEYSLYIIALVHLYGAVHKHYVDDIFLSHFPDKECDKTSNDKLLRKFGVEVVGNFYYSETFEDGEELLLHILKATHKPYFIPKKDEILKYVEEGYFGEVDGIMELKSMLAVTKNIGGVMLENVIDEISFIASFEMMPNMFFKTLESYNIPVEESDLNHLMDLFMKINNTTKKWMNNGFSPNELKYIMGLGRNDLCYCGSGKKYKKCCNHKRFSYEKDDLDDVISYFEIELE